MPQSRRSFLLLPLAAALVAAAGCAGNETRAYAKDLDPLVGRAPKDYFIEKYGEPEKRTRIDAHTDVWEFRVSDNPVTTGNLRGAVGVSTLLRLTFKDDKLASWQAFNVVR
jgi:hypothetical protein